MSKQQATIDRWGRIAIPKAIRARLGLLPGTRLIIEDHNDTVVLRWPVPDQLPLVDKDGILVVRSRTTGKIEDTEERLREARVAELVRRTGL